MATRGRKALNPSQSRPKREVGLWEGFVPPASLSDAAVSEFNRLVANLRRMGTIDRTDPKVVLNAARTQAMLDEVCEKLDDEGMVTESSNHTPMAHPLVNVMNTLLMRINKLQNDMGLTATTNKNASPSNKDKTKDGWGDLLSVTG